MNASGATCMTKLPKQALCGPTDPRSLVTMVTPARNKISVKAADVWARHTVVNHPTRWSVVYSALSVWETGHVGISWEPKRQYAVHLRISVINLKGETMVVTEIFLTVESWKTRNCFLAMFPESGQNRKHCFLAMFPEGTSWNLRQKV
jgi:hypothetical protein